MKSIYLYGAVALALLLLAAAGSLGISHYGSQRYAAGVTDGRNAVLADDARAAQALQVQRSQLDQFSALTTTALTQSLGEKLPAIEAQSHASQESIRVIYRDRPVPAELCSRPDGVQQQLDQAVDAANAVGTANVQL